MSEHGDSPLGLYVHVPFCRAKCGYCDFLSFPATAPATQNAYVAALRREIELMARRPDLSGRRFATLYVGGGTPTALPVDDLAGIIELCLSSFNFGDRQSVAEFSVGPAVTVAPERAPEVTVEANPGTVTAASLARLRAAGANRLSLGVQAFDDRLLRGLGRIHGAEQATAAIAAARAAGFANISLDLMFALPGQSLADWEATLAAAIAAAPEHISAYSLIVEPDTPFAARDAAGELVRPSEDLEADMYQTAIARLTAAGYQHYEISNFARPGYESRHNLIYWHNGEYVGVGLGAWSCLRGDAPPGHGYCRDAVTRDLAAYCAALAAGAPPPRTDAEPPSRQIELSETAIMALRLHEGLSEQAFRARFGCAIADAFPGVVERLVDQGLLARHADSIRLTPTGLPLANRVFAEFVSRDNT